MDINELKQVVNSLQNDKVLALVTALTEQKYKATSVTLHSLEWAGGFIASFYRADREYQRCVLVVDKASNPDELISTAKHKAIALKAGNKAYENIDCYCFKELPNKEDIVLKASLDDGQNMTITDLNDISNAVNANTKLLSFILPPTSRNRPKLKVDRKNKIIYDLFTTGGNIAEVKYNLVVSFIQYALFTLGDMDVDSLKKELKKSLPNLQDAIFDKAIELEMRRNDLVYLEGRYCLTEKCKGEIDSTFKVTESTEQLLMDEFESCLTKYGVEGLSQSIFEEVNIIYTSHYDGEENYMYNAEDYERKEKTAFEKILKLLVSKGKEKSESREIAKEILEVVGKSEYINKTSQTRMFTRMFNSDELEDYMSMQNRIIFLDTQILMQYLCLLYQDAPYDDQMYDSVKRLKKQMHVSKEYVKLYTTTDYVQELVNQLWQGHSLQRFLSLPYIESMGRSKNVFFNFYLYLKEEGDQFDSYDDFLSEMLEYDGDFPNRRDPFGEKIYPIVEEILQTSGVEVLPVNDIPENFDDYIKLYDLTLIDDCGINHKSHYLKENDVRCALYLSDRSNFRNDETKLSEEPFIVTQDKSLWPYQKKMVSKFKRSKYYVYPPLKLASRFAVMHFELDSSQVNYNIICMTENNLMQSSEHISFMDVISSIFQGDKVGEKLTPQRLSALKRKQVDDVSLKDFSSKHYKNQPIDLVLLELYRHYKHPIEQRVRRDKLFENNDFTDELVALLSENCQYYQEYDKVSPDLFDKFDAMMAKCK